MTHTTRLKDGSVVIDRTGAAWQLEEWTSVASGAPVRERWWYCVGVKQPIDDDGLAALAPLTVMLPRRSAA